MRSSDPLEDIGVIVQETVVLPWSGNRITVTRPISVDMLLDRAEHDPEQNLPYFAEIWPSGIALADLIAEQPEFVAGRRVLEVGCGLGITAVSAARAGASLTITDYFPESLELAKRNLASAGLSADQAVLLNWRDERSVHALAGQGPFPVVIAADVLYETRDVEPLLTFFARVLHPTGILILAEPGRPVAGRFRDRAIAVGWDVGELAIHAGPWPDPKDEGVTVRIHALRLTHRAH